MKSFADEQSLIRSIFPLAKSIEFLDATGSGLSGVGSTPGLANVILENGDEIKLFLKVCRKNSPPFVNNTLAKTMEKEITFYESILPRMSSFQEARKVGRESEMRIEKLVPKYHGSGSVHEGDLIIVLENIQARGFTAVGAKEYHTTEQVELSIRSLAKFHAVSYAMKVLDGVDWTSAVPILIDYIHCKENESFYSVFHLDMNRHYLRLLQVFLEEKDACEIVRSNLSRFCSPQFLSELQTMQPKIFEILRRCRSPVEPQGVLCHGDYHMWNVSFEEKQQQLLMFDFQIMCYASGMTDLHYYLSQSIPPATRREHRGEFLKFYTETFRAAGEALGLTASQLEPFLPAKVEEEYKRRSAFNYVFGLHYVIARLIEDRAKLALTKEMQNNREIIRTVNECGPRTWEIFQHAFDLIRETEELGTLEIMREWAGR